MRSGLEDQHLHTLALMEYFNPSILNFCAHTLQREASRLEMKCKYLRMRARLQGNGPNLLATASCWAICDRGALLLGVEAAHSASTRFALRKSKTLINLCVFSYFFLEWEYPDGWKVIGKCRMRASCTSCDASHGNEVTTQTSQDKNEWKSRGLQHLKKCTARFLALKDEQCPTCLMQCVCVAAACHTQPASSVAARTTGEVLQCFIFASTSSKTTHRFLSPS